MSVTYSSLDIISGECRLTPTDFQASLSDDPASAGVFFDHLKEGPLAAIPLVLDQSLQTPDGAVLIEAGEEMMPRLETFMRIAARNDAVLWPMVVGNAQLDAYLRNRLRGRLQQMTQRLMSDKGSVVNRFYSASERAKDLRALKALVDQIVDRFLSRPEIIAGLLRTVATEAGRDHLADAVTRAWAVVAVYRYHRSAGRYDPKEELQQIGLAAMFQDISCLLGEHDGGEGHEAASAIIVGSMEMDPAVTAAIKNHHRLRDADGTPILKTRKPPLLERVLVAVNTFMDLSARKHLSVLWVVYVLHRMAKDRFLDTEAVGVLGILYGDSRRNRLMAFFSDIIGQCVLDPEEAYPWSLFEKVPRAVICNRSHCDHAVDVVADVTVHKPVDVVLGDTRVVLAPGEYFKCPFLTGMLNDILNGDSELLDS